MMTSRFGWEWVGVSCRGRAHVCHGMPNQDSWLCRREGNIVAAAVSDGIGSCARAAQGAEATCFALTEAAFSEDWSKAPELMLQTAVEYRADILDGDLYNADSTGMLATFSEECVFAAQAGDGVVVVLDTAGQPLFILEDSKADTFANQVKGFGTSLWGVSWRYGSFSSLDVGGVLMCTDGIDFALVEDYISLASDIREAALQSSTAELRKELAALLDSWPMDGNQDDKTLVFVYRR